MKNKKIIAAILAAALVCTGMPIQGIGMTDVFATEEVSNEFEIDEDGELTKYNSVGRDIVIPDGVKTSDLGRLVTVAVW